MKNDTQIEKRNENAEALLLEIFKLVSENITDIASIRVAKDEKEAKELDEKYRIAINKVVESVAVLPYTIDELKYSINALELVISTVGKSIIGTVEGNEIEILSRLYGKRNDSDKFDKYSATLSDIFIKLKEVREQTGNDVMDFYS